MSPEQLTISDLEAVTGPPATWEGQCYGVACALAKLVEGEAVYGHYLGPVANTGYWSAHAHRPFIPHGWVLLDDGRILDPTRWSFLAVEPELAVIDENDPRYSEYDEGGDTWRTCLRGPCPELRTGSTYTLELSPELDQWVTMILPTGFDADELSAPQIAWLANLPYKELGPHAGELYSAIANAGPYAKAFIPLDNRRRAAREFGLKELG
jgi:hypothetical protein